MKKTFIFIIMAFASIVCFGQPCSFWSNWSIGGAPIFNKTFNDNWNFGQGSNLGFELRAEKMLNDNWDFRTIVAVHGFLTSDANQFDRYAEVIFGVDYKPVKYLYAFVDGGAAAKFYNFGWLAVMADAGIGAEYDFDEHNTVFCEVGMDIIAYFKSDMVNNHAFIKLGYEYNFGLTKNDKIIQQQRCILSREHFEDSIKILNSKIQENEIKETVLIERIEELNENKLALLDELKTLYRENDSLMSIINGISENQTNFYAIPFSIQFDVNSYVIKQSEMEKLNAVASIMKDDTTVCYSIIGFCDYTGSRDYNKKLSIKRANAVKDLLIKQGVSESQLKIDGYGKEKPFSNDKLPVNRRVSFYRNF